MISLQRMLCATAVATFSLALSACSPETPPELPAAAKSAPASGQGATSASAEAPATSPTPVAESAVEIPDVVALVGEKPITREDLDFQLRQQERQRIAQAAMIAQTTGKDTDSVPLTHADKQNVLDYLVRSTILLALAEQEGIEASDDVVNARVSDGRARLKDQESYNDYLKFFNMSESDLREQLARQITATMYADKVTADCAPTEEAVKAQYDEMAAKGQLEGQDEVDFWHVLVKVPTGAPDEAWDEAELKALEALERALAGEDREAIAKDLSDDPSVVRNGGFYTGMRKGVMAPEMEMALWLQPLEELAPPLKTKYGWELIQLLGRREAGTRTLEESRERVEETLRQQCAQEVLAEIVERATAELPVKVFYSFMPAAGQGATP